MLFLLSALVYSCACKCDKGDINSIYFAFKLGSTADSFTESDIDTFTVYKLTKNTTDKIDSVQIYLKRFSLSETGVYFNGTSFWSNDYLIKTKVNKDFMITDLQIESKEDNSRCKCVVNTIKKLKVNNTPYDLSGKSWNESNIELTK